MEKLEPWNSVNIDMVGPLTVKTPAKTHQLQVLTMIDPATGWFEVKDMKHQTADACMAAFDDTWLSCYPQPQILGYNNGSKYKKFEQMRKNYGMKNNVPQNIIHNQTES